MQAITDIPGLLIQRFSFNTAIAGEEYSCFGYNYLSIVPDGVINPLVNYPGDSQDLEKDFYLQFKDRAIVLINGPIENLPITGRDQFKLYYQAYSLATAKLQGGYGTFYLILSRTRIPAFKHFVEMPSFCYNTQIPASTNYEYWFGVDCPDASYQLGHPFIPLGFKKLSYIVYSDAINFRVTFSAYAKCFNNTPLQIFNVVANTALTSADVFGANRYLIDIQNNDGGPKYVKVMLLWHERGMT